MGFLPDPLPKWIKVRGFDMRLFSFTPIIWGRVEPFGLDIFLAKWSNYGLLVTGFGCKNEIGLLKGGCVGAKFITGVWANELTGASVEFCGFKWISLGGKVEWRLFKFGYCYKSKIQLGKYIGRHQILKFTNGKLEICTSCTGTIKRMLGLKKRIAVQKKLRSASASTSASDDEEVPLPQKKRNCQIKIVEGREMHIYQPFAPTKRWFKRLLSRKSQEDIKA